MKQHPSTIHKPVARVLDRVDAGCQQIRNMSLDEARRRMVEDGAAGVAAIEGSFALWTRDGETILMARSLDRPLRYFLAKEKDGPMLIVSDRIDAIAAALDELGYGDQFHPSYTRMVPAHHVTSLRLIGCPDPNPSHQRFFDPPAATLPGDLDRIGERYVTALVAEVRDWLEALPADEPIGVLFSGGLDSGAVLLALYHQLLDLGQSAARLKAFTLAVGAGGDDLEQAREFLRRVDLEMLGETIEAPVHDLDPLRAVEVIEDYKALDVECAAALLALTAGIRRRYPEWRLLVDGDGGDENLKDYPIEDNPELTIRSVVGNSMLYQEGWGVDAVKHSLTYSGGFSRGCVRGWAPARLHGFTTFSPFTAPPVIAVAEAIPFDALTRGDHQRLYSLKGEVLARGMRRVLGVELPVFAKRRLQEGAVDAAAAARLNVSPHRYREHFLALHTPA